jgi:uncharacterized glyoxalase superfamily protein PhnB
MTVQASQMSAEPMLGTAYPQLFVSDMTAACAFFVQKLGFMVAFTYGEPASYGQVRRGRARLNLRHVDRSVFDGDIRAREHLLSAYIPVDHVETLYRECQRAGVALHQPLMLQPWGAQDFIVQDPDGNLIGFSSPTEMQD